MLRNASAPHPEHEVCGTPTASERGMLLSVSLMLPGMHMPCACVRCAGVQRAYVPR